MDSDPQPQNIAARDNASYVAYVKQHLDSFRDDNMTHTALTLYPFTPGMGQGDNGGEYALTSMVTDLRVTCPLDSVMTSRPLTYRYVVNAAPSSPMHNTRSSYGAKYAFNQLDVLAFFASISDFMSDGPNNADKAFMENLQNSVVQFLKSGEPADSHWMGANITTAVINQTNTYVPSPYHAEHCHFWLNSGLANYAWRP